MAALASDLLICFLCPAIKWPGHIVLPLSVIPSFRPSVIPDSVSAHYLSHTLRFSNEIWYIVFFYENTQVEFEFGSGWIIFVICPLDLEKFHKFSVSAQYLYYKLSFWIEIRYIDVSRKCAGGVWFGSGLIIFGRVICPLDLQKFH